MKLEIDWPLTLSWWALGIALASAFFAWQATRYAKLGYRLQKREHDAGPTGIKVTDEELSVLRMIDDDGPLRRAFYVGEPGHETTSVSAWCFANRQCVRGRDYVPQNDWFRSTLDRLDGRNLIVQANSQYRLTEHGGLVVRNERGRETHAPPLEFRPMQGG